MILRSYQTPHQIRVVPLPAVNGSVASVPRQRDYIHIRPAPMHVAGIRIIPSIEDIRRATAAHYGLPQYELSSERRSQVIAYPRQVAMCLARALTNASLPTIGRCFGGRDHSTVILAIRRAEARLAADPRVGESMRSISAAVARAVEQRDWEFRRGR